LLARVLHVVVAGEIGGAERMLVDLASSPEETRAEHVIALMTPNEGLAGVFEGAGLRVRDRGRVRENPAAFLWRSLGPADVRWLTGVIAEERANLVHLHTFGSQVPGTRAALRAGVPVVRTEHSTRVYDDASCWPFSRWSLERVDLAVAISAHVEQAALTKAPWARPKLRIVRNGVDTERFAPTDPPAGPFTFTLVGRLEPRKGVDIALDALALVPDARLRIVGDGEDRSKLERHARAAGLTERVDFVGYANDTRPHLAASHALVCSSRQEGLGIALLEGMAMGRAVVAVPVGGVPEIVQDGVTGFLATEGTATALAARMRDSMQAGPKLRTLGAAARTFVVEQASVRAMREGYGRVYEELLRTRHRG
jgi:glycosyltransferase involved in cell wall biosynthesis